MTRAPGGEHDEPHAEETESRGPIRRGSASRAAEATDASTASALARAAAMLDRLDLGLAALGRASRISRHFRRKEALCAVRPRHPGLWLSEAVLYGLDAGEAAPANGVGEAAAYANALDHGLRESHRPVLSTEMLIELHTLVVSNDPAPATPGVPRPSMAREDIATIVEGLDRRQAADREPPVVMAANATAAIEEIRPFRSGNRRLSQLVTYLLLAPAFQRSEPAIYPSLYFARRHSLRRELLDRVRSADVASGWIRFYADGIAASARTALAAARQLDAVARNDAARIRGLGYAARSALRVHVALQAHPVAAMDQILETSGLRVQAATRAIHRLRALGVIREVSGGGRHRIYSYHEYARLLAAGTGPG